MQDAFIFQEVVMQIAIESDARGDEKKKRTSIPYFQMIRGGLSMN